MRVGRKVGRGGIQPGDRADSAREERASPSLIRAELCSELEMQGCQRAEAVSCQSKLPPSVTIYSGPSISRLIKDNFC